VREIELRFLDSGRNTPEQLADAHYIRRTVFMEEQGFSSDADGIDERAILAVAYCEGKPVGTARTFPDNPADLTRWHIGRVAVLKEYRSEGVGRMLMEALEQRAVAGGAREIRIGSQQHAVGFYGRLGFLPAGETYMEEFCPHVPLLKMI